MAQLLPLYFGLMYFLQAFILFIIETMRFKSPAVVKIHKLGNVSRNAKTRWLCLLMDDYTAACLAVQRCSVESQLRVERNVNSADQNRRGREFLGAAPSICASLRGCHY